MLTKESEEGHKEDTVKNKMWLQRKYENKTKTNGEKREK
jgi:hypothetical protein